MNARRNFLSIAVGFLPACLIGNKALANAQPSQDKPKPIDLEAAGATPHPCVNKYGHLASPDRQIIHLEVDMYMLSDDPSQRRYLTPDYATVIAPRLRILLGRDPIFGDQWYNGYKFLTYTGLYWRS